MIRKAVTDDIAAIEAVINDGRAYLKHQGLPQWQNGTGPQPEDIRRDIGRGEGYVMEDAAGEVYAYAALCQGVDDSYTRIKQGGWDTTREPYVSIHRVALRSGFRGKGLSAGWMDALVRQAAGLGYRDIRVDTHEQNAPMRRVVQRAGFLYRGKVLLPIPNGERLAYQLLLED